MAVLNAIGQFSLPDDCWHTMTWSAWVCKPCGSDTSASVSNFFQVSRLYAALSSVGWATEINACSYVFNASVGLLLPVLLFILLNIQIGPKSKPQTSVHSFAKYRPIFKIFHQHILWEICNKVVTADTTTP